MAPVETQAVKGKHLTPPIPPLWDDPLTASLAAVDGTPPLKEGFSGPCNLFVAANELVQFNSSTPNLTYDANGNLVSQTNASGTTTYMWDARNRLTGLSGPGVSASFTYDALGRRINKTVNGVKTDYLYDGNDIVAEIGGGAVSATYLRSLNVDEPFVRQGSVSEYYHTDVLGSVLALSDGSGTVQTTYRYDPFGNTTVTGSSSNVFQYTGREADGTGLLFYRARFYSPTLQRFISEDPLEFLAGDFNLYVYAGNSPLNFVDPDGEIRIFLPRIFNRPIPTPKPKEVRPTPGPEQKLQPAPPAKQPPTGKELIRPTAEMKKLEGMRKILELIRDFFRNINPDDLGAVDLPMWLGCRKPPCGQEA